LERQSGKAAKEKFARVVLAIIGVTLWDCALFSLVVMNQLPAPSIFRTAMNYLPTPSIFWIALIFAVHAVLLVMTLSLVLMVIRFINVRVGFF